MKYFDETLVNAKIISTVISNYSAKTIKIVLENLHKDLKISKIISKFFSKI